MESDGYYMRLAIREATKNGTPYGALLLNKVTGAFIVRANTTASGDKTAHAEMNLLRDIHLLNGKPKDLAIYSTGEPCPMCISAILWCGIKDVNYGLGIKAISRFHKQIDISAIDIIQQSFSDCKVEGKIQRDACLQLFTRHS